MSRNVRAAATALALAGGVYLAGAAPVEASNMGFKLERSFNLVRRASDNRPLQNIYWMSRPFFDGVGDVANTGFAGLNKCVGDADGPPAGEGERNSDDVVCELYTARQDIPTAGTFSLSYIDRDTCTKFTRNAQIQLGTRVAFTGVPFALQPDIGYEVKISVPGAATYSPQNRGVIVGSHDPSFPGRSIYAAPTCTTPGQTNCCGANAPRLDLVSLVYHTMWQTSFEILCGLEGVDWVDNTGPGGVGPADGRPDTCWEDDPPTGNGNYRFDTGETSTGVFDGRNNMTVYYFNNTEAVNAPVNHNVVFSPLAGLSFSGTQFDLVPGDAYLLQISKLHNPPTRFLSPHF